ncbi:MAG: hypothetical protein AUK55_15500 [Syntrophobacteraceae bacterium CG2_30_61_12]|nr:MAG: hypothetical protein AUK55_15500 [Syntrophobacteraceae bacterium CG2_30_61_12]
MTAEVLKQLRPRLEEARQRHRERFGAAVTDLTRKLSREQAFQLDLILSAPGFLEFQEAAGGDWKQALGRYLSDMQWVIWGDCELGPPLALQCRAAEIALGVLAYLGARLMDDAIDGHHDYKGRTITFYGRISEALADPRAATATAAAGAYLVHEALRRLEKHGYRTSAETLRALYSKVFAGALAEALAERTQVSRDCYDAVVAHKAVAYDRLLHEVFFSTCPRPLRARVIEVLARHSEISQWLNDFQDEADDFRRAQLSLLRVSGMDRERAEALIVSALAGLYRDCRRLPPALSDALSLRLLDSVTKFEDETGHGG